MAALGFQLGLTGKRVHILVAFLSIMWTVVIVDILDLASPRIGALRAGDAVYDWTLQGFKGGLQIRRYLALVLRIKQMVHCRLARYRIYRRGPRSDQLYHLIVSEH